MDSNGRVFEDNEGIAECLMQYYQNLFRSTNQKILFLGYKFYLDGDY